MAANIKKRNVGFPGRRPVWLGVYPGSLDLQALPPRSWCCGCGAEVFRRGAMYCKICQKEAENVHKK